MSVSDNINKLRQLRTDHVVKTRNGRFMVMVGSDKIKSFATEKKALEYQKEINIKLIENPRLVNAAITKSKGGKLKKSKMRELPKSFEREYMRGIQEHFNNIQEIVEARLINRLQEVVPENKNDSIRYDSLRTKLEEIFTSTREGITREFDGGKIFEGIKSAANSVVNSSRDNFNRATSSVLGIDTSDDSGLDDIIDLFGMENASQIENVSDELMTEIERSVTDGIRKGIRPEEIASRIMAKDKDFEGFKGRFKKAENRIRFIARNQIEQLNADITRTRMKNAGLNKFIWRTSRDDRVRPDHMLEGQIFEWDKPKSTKGKRKPKRKLNPGEDFNCRCWSEPYFPELLGD